MNHKLFVYKKRLLILSVMFICVALITGVSYALFTSTTSQEDENSLAASCMNMEFSGKNEINLTNAYPITENEAEALTPYTFTITNKCDNYIEYYVIASVIDTSTSADSKYVKVSLSGDTDKVSEAVTSLKTITTPQSLNGYNIKDNYILKEGDGISKGESRTFNFRMWLDGDNSNTWTTEELENKTYQVKISVVGTVKTSKDDLFIAALIDGKESSTFPTTDDYVASVTCTKNGKIINTNPTITWDGTKWKLSVEVTTGNVRCNAKFIQATTLYQTILADNEVKTPTTTPGFAISAGDEALLASAEDDYGTSYYFRGAVTNNYVEFANKCWRIVRIGGDNTVKLLLHNDNTTRAANPCSSVNNEETAAFARYDGDEYYSQFNSNYNDNAYVGFMYGIPSSSTYEATHANTNKSTILTNLETWYNNYLKGYESLIADNVLCTDKNNITDTAYNPRNLSYVTGLGYGTNATYYGTTQRLASSSGNAGGTGLSLECNGELSKITSKIGLITADELAFAGYAVGIVGSPSYLQENATAGFWWSLSPFNFDGSDAYVWCVVGGFGGLDNTGVDTAGGVRPYISLKSSIIISKGTGTSEDPYVISLNSGHF